MPEHRRGAARASDFSFTVVLVLLLGAQPVATDLYLPALPAIARDIGPASTSLTLFVLAFGMGQLLCGPLADRAGRRPVLLGGLCLYAMSAIGAALSASVTLLAVCRGFQGLAMAAILVCARAAVRDTYAARDGPHVMSKGLTGLGVVAMLAPLLGALVVQFFSWRWALACMALYALAVLLWCWYFFAETRRPEHALTEGRLGDVLGSASFWAWSCLATTSFGGMFCFLLLSPAIYVDYLGLTPWAYGWIPASGSLAYIASTSGCRRLLVRMSPVRAVRLASYLSLTGALTQVAAVALLPHQVWPLLLGHWVFAIGHGVHQPCGQAGAVGEFPHLAGRAVAWSGFFMMAVAFLLGQIVVQFMHADHRYGAWPLAAPMLVAGVILVLISHGWLPRAAAGTSGNEVR